MRCTLQFEAITRILAGRFQAPTWPVRGMELCNRIESLPNRRRATWVGWICKESPESCPSVFKVPRSPTGIAAADDPASIGYEGERIGLAFGEVDSSGRVAVSSYHNLIPDKLAGASRVPLTADGECRMPYEAVSAQHPPPFAFQGRSGISFTLTTFPGEGGGGGVRGPGEAHNDSHVTIRSFYPSTTPGVMELEWETFISPSNDWR